MRETTPALAFRGMAPAAPAQLAALRLAEIEGLRRYGTAFLLGVLAAAALPPVDITPVLVISCTGLVWLFDGVQRPREAFLLGWSFGLGYFVAGLYWIAAALFVDIAQFWWLTPFAVLGVPAGLAIFTGGALVAAYLLCRLLRWRGVARVLAVAVCWSLAEWLRGHVLTGFPWNLLGYAWSGGFPGSLAMLQCTATIGIYGLSLLTVVLAMLPATLGDFGRWRLPPTVIGVLTLAAVLGYGAVRLGPGTTADVPGVSLRLVQPSIPQRLKNDPAQIAADFRAQLALSAERGGDDSRPATVIWSEGNAPPLLERADRADLRRAMAAALPPGGLMIVGSDRAEPLSGSIKSVWNSMVAIDDKGEIVGDYDKVHLVPFGEYVPLRGYLPINKITPGTLDFSAGPGLRTLHLPGLPPFSPLICYEAIFPHAVVDPADRPAWLLNITDDAWYGFTSGPFQHFSIARVRTVEEGLPLVRVGNNGISGVIDPFGRVLKRLGLDSIGVLDVALPAALPPTPYVKLGDLGYWLTLASLFVLASICGWLRRKSLGAQ
jgi:apolipoprotein N-acyltransferase